MPLDPASTREPLTRQRVLDAAVAIADAAGLDALTMRALAVRLGVSPMALYKHVADKDAILDGIVELVLAEIAVPDADASWREALELRAASARHVLTGHSWAMGLIESRGVMGPASLRQAEAVIGSLRAAGLGVQDAAHAFWLLDSFVYGHVVQEAGIAARSGSTEPGSGDAPPESPAVAPEAPLRSADELTHPNLVALREVAARGVFTLDRAFDIGLHLVLEAIGSMIDDAITEPA